MNLMRLLVAFDILPFDEPAARTCGKIRADLERIGMLRLKLPPDFLVDSL